MSKWLLRLSFNTLRWALCAVGVVALALTGTGVVLRRLATIGDSEK